MALAACIRAISPASKAFIEASYGGLSEYLTTCVEAEVRKRKALPAATAALEGASSANATSVAAGTAAASAAAVVQSAIAKSSEK